MISFTACGFHLVTGEAVVEKIRTCDTESCDAEELSPDSPVSLQVHLKKAPHGTRVMSRWFYMDPEKGDILLRERLSEVDHAQLVTHRLEVPRPGYWKPGSYRVEVFVRDRSTGTRTFCMPQKPVPEPVEPTEPPRLPPGEKDILDDDF